MADKANPNRTRWAGWAVAAVIAVGAVAAWFLLDPGLRGTPDTTTVAADMPKDEFERRVRAYLLKQPEVIAEAVQKLRERQLAAQQAALQSVIRARADEIFRDPAAPVGGNPNGDVTVVEFFDYNCPYCRQVAPIMEEAEAADPKLRIVYKEFPILGENSKFAARAALAAHKQSKYIAFHKAMMKAKGGATPSAVLAIAKEVGLDVERLEADMKDPAIEKAIQRNLVLAGALRINGTPAFVVGEDIIRGATDLETLKGSIQKARTNPAKK